MTVIIKMSFPAGRYHATPWGRHVNEGVPEWPPSPWRLLRALVAVWRRTRPEFPADQVRRVLEALSPPPLFRVPAFRVAHTRHYMPWEKKGPLDRTLVFDTFVAVGRCDPLFIGWPDGALSAQERSLLATLLRNLVWLGRAEGWIHAALVDEQPAWNCTPAEPGDANPVPVFCADVLSAFDWRRYPILDPAKLAKGRVSISDYLFDCPRWHLCLDTGTIQSEKWPGVPGARWVNYTLPAEASASRTSPLTRRARPTVARFALDGPVLPLTTRTLPVAEQARRSLLSICRSLARREHAGLADAELWPMYPALWGKDAERRPSTGHQHAFFLPADEDGDGWLDHLTVFAPMGFNQLEVSGLERLRTLQSDEEELSAQLVGVGCPAVFAGTRLFESSSVWDSATPFVVTRHFKRRGRKKDSDCFEDGAGQPRFVEKVLREELRHRDFPQANDVEIDHLEAVGALRMRPLQFRLSRRKPGDDGGRRPRGVFRLRFPAPIPGPLALGHSCHFGLGLFLPAGQDT